MYMCINYYVKNFKWIFLIGCYKSVAIVLVPYMVLVLYSVQNL